MGREYGGTPRWCERTRARRKALRLVQDQSFADTVHRLVTFDARTKYIPVGKRTSPNLQEIANNMTPSANG